MRARRFGPSALALASGLVLSSAFPPLDWGVLALLALAPLCWLWHDASPRRAAWFGFVAGLGFFAPLLSWTWHFGAIAIVPLVAANAAYWAATGFAVGWFGRAGLRSPWLTAAVWVPFEALRGAWPLGGLPWGWVGNALHDVAPARSLASWGGVLLVSFAIVAANGLLADLVRSARTRTRVALIRACAGLATVLAVTVLGHVFRIETRPTDTLRVALLQGNDQDRYLTQQEIEQRVITRRHFALADQLEGDYDLIVFPESSLDGDDPREYPGLQQRLVEVARQHDSFVLVNGIIDDTEGRSYNANIMYSPDGEVVGTYAKQHLVPFGEFVPFRSLLGWVDQLRQVPTDFTPGNGNEIFDVRGARIGTVICFESAFGPLVRDVVRDGAEVIVVSTNNRSYRRSANSAQHLAMSQMRAAETGRPVVHASISGITALIDADGNVHDTTELFENAITTGDVVATTGDTPYVRFGDWVPWGCFLAVIGSGAVVSARRLRARRESEPARTGP